MSSVQAGRTSCNYSGRVASARWLPRTPQSRSFRRTTRCICRADSGPQQAGSSSTSRPGLPPPPAAPQQQEQQQQQQQLLARRGILALAAAAAAGGVSPVAAPLQAGAAAVAEPAAAPATPKPPAPPVVVPPLTETYYSSEGFAFDYPAGWVVAFDRSGSTGSGAVIVVGDFRALVTVSVFRIEPIPQAVAQEGLSEQSGYALCVQPQQAQPSTMRFQLLRSELVPPAPGSSPPPPPAQGDDAAGGKGGGGSGGAAYEFEYSVESCAGEVEEGLGGKLRCLSFGAVIPSQRRRHIGRCVLANGRAYSLNASSPEDRWAQVGPVVQQVVSTFRS